MGGALPPGFENYNDVVYDIETRFTVKSLKALCGALGAPVSGAKGVLQQRLRALLLRILNNQDTALFNMGKTAAETERGTSYNASRLQSRPNGFHPVSSTGATASTSQGNNWGMSSLYNNVRLPVYKKLPFYNILTNITQGYTIPACPTSRTTQPIQVRLTTEMLSKLQPKSPSNPYRLVLFSTQTERIHFSSCVIEFPAHAEIRCNGSIVSANLRGIKNKPGTVNPPDVTPHSILTQGVTNKIDVTFAESKASFTLTVYLVEKLTVEQLVDKIKKKGATAKETTLNKMRAAQQDNDIVPGPETLTLKDPISMTRIDIPCKSRWCNHTACFDAATFLMLNEQTPTWVCPICNRSVPSEDDLYIDGYFKDILERTNKAVESVIVHPDGTWTNKDIDTDHPDAKLLNNQQPSARPRLTPEDRRLSSERKLSFGPPKAEIVSLDDDDEDTGAPTPASLPPPQPRTSSTSVRPSPSTPSRKRGPPQVVDLTLSDDEEMPPARRPAEQPAPKRIRVDPAPSMITTNDVNGVNRMSMHLNGVSPASTIRESHIRSPPSSISPRNENSNSMFRFNQPSIALDAQPSFRPPGDYTIPANTLSTHLSSLSSLPIFSPTHSRPSLPSLSQLNNHPYQTASSTAYPTSSSTTHPTTTTTTFTNNNDTTTTRSTSASPVLPAFSPAKPRQSSNSFPSLDWDADYPSMGARQWDSERDEIYNEDLDLEMARLPSSMFDADAGRDWDDDY